MVSFGNLFEVGVKAAGLVLGSKSNDKAAEISAAASAATQAELREAKARGVDAIRAGTAGFERSVAPILAIDASGLTPDQKIGLEDVTRDGNAFLASSGLRGAGRAGVGQVLDQRRRFTAAAQRDNRDRIDQARYAIGNIRAQEGGSIANTEIGTGNRIGESITSAGQTQAGAELATGRLQGDALGTIGAIIAADAKSRRTGVDDTTSRRDV